MFQQQAWADEPELLATGMASGPADCDMDMMDTSYQAQFPGSQGQDTVQPGPFHHEVAALNVAGRMPTPIHCSFAAQVRGSSWTGAAGSTSQGGPQGMTAQDLNRPAFSNNSVADASMIGHESVPRSLDGPAAAAQVMADWNMVQNRRLPSPISESGGEDSSIESPQMILDSTSSAQMPSHHLDRLTHQHPLLSTLPVRSSSAMELGQGEEVSPSPPRESTPGSVDGSMDVESTSPSPKKGHTRSRHTLNSWTALQPGMKRSFSIGYRADCEKCRMKVPGHFNHIIIS